MRKLLSVLLAISLFVCFYGFILSSSQVYAAESGKKFSFKASTYASDASPIMVMIKDYVKYVAEKTDGNVEIVVYPSEQLGGYEETFEETMRGTIEMGFNSVSSAYDINLSCANVPGIAENLDDLEKIIRPGSTIFNTVSKAMDGLNIKLLGYMSDGYQNLIFAGDLEQGYGDPGVKKKSVIRVPSGQDTSGLLEAIGYNTAALPGVEVYNGLQTKVVNGAVGIPDNMVLTSFVDVVDHIVDIKLTFSADWVFINKSSFDSLPPEYQKVMLDGMEIFMADNMKMLHESNERTVKALKDAGIDYVNLTPDERQKINGAIQTEYWPLLESKFGADFLAGVKKDVTK